MATIDIPDKICPHCGGIRWVEMKYKRKRTTKVGVYYHCAKKLNENTKKYHKTLAGKASLKKAENTQVRKLKDYYIINNIYVQLYRNGVKLDRKSITQEQIQMYRESLLMQRKLKELK